MTVVVEPRGNEWVVLHTGVPHSRHRLKRRAEEEGKRIARKYGCHLQVMRQNGRYHYGDNFSIFGAQ